MNKKNTSINDFEKATPTMLESALTYRDKGFNPFPLGSANETPPHWFIERCKNINDAKEKWPKTPLINWAEFQTVQPTIEKITEWWTKWPNANIALATGINFVVVDADSDEAIQCVRANLPPTPMTVKTSRGMHFYYRTEDGVIIKNSTSKYKIDVRGVGGYVVAPPSVHSSGHRYSFVKFT